MVLLRSTVEKLYLLQAVFKEGGHGLAFSKPSRNAAVVERCVTTLKIRVTR